MKHRGERYSVTLAVLFVLVSAATVYLFVENRRLQRLVDDPKTYFAAIRQEGTVPAIRASDVFGQPCQLTYGTGEPARVLCWLAMQSDPTEANIPFWNSLAREQAAAGVRVIGMCAGEPEEVRGYVEERGVAFPVIAASDAYIVEVYGGNVVPQTMLISPRGEVTARWPGVLAPEQQRELLVHLNEAAKLMGKTPDSPEEVIP